METKTSVFLSLIAVATSGTALAVSVGGSPPAPAPSDDPLLRESVTHLTARLETLVDQHEDLRVALDRAATSPRALREPLTSPSEEVEAIVERVLDDRMPNEPLAMTVTIDDAVARLRNLGPRAADNRELWAQLRDDDSIGEVVDAFEQWAALQPGNPDTQVQLGQVYLQQLILEGSAAPANLATDALDAFDRALEASPEHWDARFSKARSLSFWPAGYGRMGEAISEFETLMTQQEGRPQSDRHVDTYVWLGNLYAQQGDVAQARTTWQRGLGYHPSSSSLAERLEQYAPSSSSR